MTFLIVEDNSKMRSFIASLIKHEADKIIECDDGDCALELYAKFKPDWVLMDIRMKKVNGIKATRSIKKSYPDAKIMMITTHDTPEYRKASLDAGAKEFVSKNNMSLIHEKLFNANYCR